MRQIKSSGSVLLSAATSRTPWQSGQLRPVSLSAGAGELGSARTVLARKARSAPPGTRSERNLSLQFASVAIGLDRASTRAMPKSDLPALPSLPAITLSIDRDRSEHAPRRAFLTIRRLELRARFPDGTVSEPFFYDIVERKALDAVVVAPHFRDEAGTRKVLLRSALRPPVVFRPRSAWPMPERETLGGLWEF